MRKKVFLFGGQGSKYRQMGKGLYEHSKMFRKYLTQCDDIVKSVCSESLLSDLYENPKIVRDEPIFYSHLQIFSLEYALAKYLLKLGIEPDYLVGTSLGEFTCAALSEALDLERIIGLLVKQAELLDRERNKSCMVAVMAGQQVYGSNPVFLENAELAAVNFDRHFVIAGGNSSMEKILEFMKDNDILYQKVSTGIGFHSKAIDFAREEFLAELGEPKWKQPVYPIISAMTGGRIDGFPKDYLWEVIRKTIRFQTVIEQMEREGEYDYIDLTPTGTLAAFVKYNLKEKSGSKARAVLNPVKPDYNGTEQLVREMFV